jgi:hypothetical protein
LRFMTNPGLAGHCTALNASASILTILCKRI